MMNLFNLKTHPGYKNTTFLFYFINDKKKFGEQKSIDQSQGRDGEFEILETLRADLVKTRERVSSPALPPK